MKQNNEGKCLDAVLRVLERQHGATRKILERDTPASRGIELACEIGDARHALEHTLVEPFPNNQKDNVQFIRIFDTAFEPAVKDVLNPNLSYTILTDVYAFDGMTKKQLSVTRQGLIDWIRSTAPQMPAPTNARQTSLRAEPPTVPVAVRLNCHHSKQLGGRLLPGRIAPEELEDLRRERLLKALRDKGPKLVAAKAPGTSTRTVLVLENQDIALTSEGGIQELIEELRGKVLHMPDDVFIVNTYSGGHYYVVQLRKDGSPCLLFGDRTGDWSFDANRLDDI